MDERTQLAALASEFRELILLAWTQLIQESGIGFSQRPEASITEHCRLGLDSIVAALERREPVVTLPGQPLFGHNELIIGASQLDSTLAFLLGRQAVVDQLRSRIPPGRFVETVHILNHAIGEAISYHGNLACQVCMARQDERRDRVQRRFESVIERSQDAIVLFDEDRVVHSWNSGAESLFGWSALEMVGQSLDRIVPLTMLADGEAERLTGELFVTGHARRSDVQRRRKDGSLVHVDASYTAVRDADGRSLGIWAIFRDITERKNLEEAKLQSERLALIGTMSAKLAHEVRNPLTSIVLNLDLVQETLRDLEPVPQPAGSESRELIASIESEVQRIQRVVEDYLRFARLPNLRPEPTQLDEVLSRHLSLMEPELAQRHIKLELSLAARGARVPADESQLWQAILNLVRNAMESMAGGGRLRVSTGLEPATVVCDIEDTGCGMTEEVVAQIFRPFYSTKRGGTGLGLPLTQQIIQEHHGSLECTSQPGRGTRFRMRLPLASGGEGGSGRANLAAKSE